MSFPQIFVSQFDYDSSYTVKSNQVGRLDLIANDIYGYVQFYLPLAEANGIVLPQGFRVGMRPLEESIYNQFYAEGLRGAELAAVTADAVANYNLTAYDWLYYGDTTTGIVSDVYENRLLAVPTFDSAYAWLQKYQYPTAPVAPALPVRS